MRLAYVVLAHVVPEQLDRLITRLDDADDTFFVHIDRKVDTRWFISGLGDAARKPNVHLVDRVSISWSDFGMLEATLNGMKAAATSGVPFDYLVLLTGRDYPLKPPSEIRSRLAAADGRFFMEVHELPRADWDQEGGLERLRHPHVRLVGPRRRPPYVGWRHTRLPLKRRLPERLAPYQGSAFWWLPRDCVDYVLRTIDEQPEVLKFFRRAFAPEESFFHTTLMNSPHAERLVNDYLRHTEWRPEYWPHGTILEAADFSKLQASPQLFASKFDIRRDAEILDLVDRELLDR